MWCTCVWRLRFCSRTGMIQHSHVSGDQNKSCWIHFPFMLFLSGKDPLTAVSSICNHRARRLWQHGVSTEKCRTAVPSTWRSLGRRHITLIFLTLCSSISPVLWCLPVWCHANQDSSQLRILLASKKQIGLKCVLCSLSSLPSPVLAV